MNRFFSQSKATCTLQSQYSPTQTSTQTQTRKTFLSLMEVNFLTRWIFRVIMIQFTSINQIECNSPRKTITSISFSTRSKCQHLNPLSITMIMTLRFHWMKVDSCQKKLIKMLPKTVLVEFSIFRITRVSPIRITKFMTTINMVVMLLAMTMILKLQVKLIILSNWPHLKRKKVQTRKN